jgi:putative transcriptional regulator
VLAPAKGRLLVATPPLVDENFDRSVVLLIEHGPEGALGVILNRPSGTEVAEAVPGWERLAADPPVVFVGGPVGDDSALAVGLARRGDQPDGWLPVVDRLGTVDLHKDPLDLASSIEVVRVFAGYAGWTAGQLEAEIEAGGWIVAAAEPGDGVSREPQELWRAVLRRQPGTLAWLANYPDDISVN